MSKRNLLVAAGVALLAMFAVISASANVSAKQTYVFVSTQDLTGPVASLGSPVSDGVKTCVASVNKSGGVNGHRIRYDVLDDATNPDKAVTNMKQLLGEKPVAVINHVTSTVMIPVTKLLDQAKVPGMGYAPVAELTSDPYFYSMGISTLNSYYATARYIQKKMGSTKPKVAIIGLQTPSGMTEAQTTKSTLEGLGWDVTDVENIPLTATDASSQAIRVASGHPEYVILGLLGFQIPFVSKGLQDAGLRVPMIDFAPTSDDATLASVHSDLFLVMRDVLTATEPTAASAKLRTAASAAGVSTQANLGSPSFTKGYLVCKAFVAALKVANCGDKCTGQSVKAGLDKLAKFSTDGLAPGPLHFSKTDHQGLEKARVVRWDASKGLAVAVSSWFPASAPK